MSEEQIAKRSIGRPPNALKKGNPSWSPANITEIENKEDGFVYRRISKNPDNVAKKKLEGWELVSGIESNQTTAEPGYGRIEEGKPLTSVLGGTDWMLARIPEEQAAARQDYFRKETGRRTQGLTAHVKKEMKDSGTNAHGSITISSKQGTQVIE